MKINELIGQLTDAAFEGSKDIEFEGIQEDSRHVKPGQIFIAIRGLRSDGHEHVVSAAEKGAVAAIVEELVPSAKIPQIVVPNTSEALGEAEAYLAGNPANGLQIVGITGTNGKTTTSFLLESMLKASGAIPGIIGTVSYRFAGKDKPAPYTTPTPRILQETLSEMKSAGCTHIIMEVSSAALSMRRLAGIQLDVAAFSNLSQDHLDVHGSMEEYQAAKALLFSRRLKVDGKAIVNIDDSAGEAMLSAASTSTKLRVSRSNAAAEICTQNESSTIAGISASFKTPRGLIPVKAPSLLGDYNVENLALAIGICEALNISFDAIADGIYSLDGVPGRVERVKNDKTLNVLVDYAHTPDALESVLSALRPLTKGRLICVFGCGGDRDPSKRPAMGKAVADHADLAIVTSDNPRTEEPQSIIDMILPSVPDPFFVHPNRRIAIQEAIYEATPIDVVLIAGKGHEDYQIIGEKKTHFDDREEARTAIETRPTYAAKACSEVSGGTITGPDGSVFSRVVIDSRKTAPGDLYVAIKGETFDGHSFTKQAVDAGATGVLVENGRIGELKGQVCAIETPDPRLALGQIAGMTRQQASIPVVAVTGSSGKTTTKELIRYALGEAGPVLATKGSMNNETGVPLTLLKLRSYHRYAVIEMGMRALGDIDYLCQFTEPTVGVVTNIGTAHVGVVGSVDKIRTGKAEVFPKTGTAVFPSNDDGLRKIAGKSERRISFGYEKNADVQIKSYRPIDLGSVVELSAFGKHLTVKLGMIGRHNALNAACAIAVAEATGVDTEVAALGISKAKPAAMRGQVELVKGRNVLVDCYNANPASMKAALNMLVETASTTPFAILGDMLELGDSAEEAHRQLGRSAAEMGIVVFCVGSFASMIAAGAHEAGGRATVVNSLAEAAESVLTEATSGSWILLKASRALKLEQCVPLMRDSSQD